MTNYRVKTLKNNPNLERMAVLIPDVVFSTAAGAELKMQIIMPWRSSAEGTIHPRNPLIVFLQGSTWTSPNVNYQIPQLAEYARKGFVVATITHRSFKDGYPAPAFLKDAKTAIRFLRKNADEYGIDPNRVCFWGTSSGGNTSLLVALTGDDPKYKTEEYPEVSDAVSVAVDCFGPTDLTELFIESEHSEEEIQFFNGFVSDDPTERIKTLKEISPFLVMKKNREYPPILLIHGDADTSVPYGQSEKMYRALLDNGYDAEMIHVENAPHEGSFWSQELHAEIFDFIKRKI